MAETIKKKTFRDLAQIFFRHRRLFFVSAALFAIVVLVAANVITVEYTSSGKFERRVEQALREAEVPEVSGWTDFEDLKVMLIQQVSGPETVERAAERLGLFDDLKTGAGSDRTLDAVRKARVESLRRAVDIRWESQGRKVDLVTVTFTYSNPDIAMRMANLLIDEYCTMDAALRKSRLTEARNFLSEKAHQFDAELEKMTARKIQLETEYVGIQQDAQAEIVRREQQCKADLDAVRRLRDIAKQKCARLLAMKKEMESTTQPVQVIKGPNPELERLGSELREYKVELDLAVTLQHMRMEHPAIQTLVTRIRLMEERIRNTPAEITLQTVYGQGGGADTYAAQVAAAQSEVEILSGEYDRVESQILGFEKMMRDYRPAREEFTQVVERVNAISLETQGWYSRLRSVDMALAAEQADQRLSVKQVEAASRPNVPSFPKLLYVLAVAFGGGLMFGGALMFASNAKDRSINTAEDAAEYFNIPIQGIIGEVLTRQDRALRAVHRYVVRPTIVLVLALVIVLSTTTLVYRLYYPEKYQQLLVSPSQVLRLQASAR